MKKNDKKLNKEELEDVSGGFVYQPFNNENKKPDMPGDRDFMITPSGLNSTESNSGKKNSGINKQKLI